MWFLDVWMHPWPEQLASVGHHSFAVKRPGIFLLAFVRGLALDRAGRAGKLCPQRHKRRGFRLKFSGVMDIRWNLQLGICKAVNVTCGNPTHPKCASLATLFGFVLFSPVKHLSECKLLLSHTPLHGLCLPDARDYRRCNLPASLVSYPTGSDSSDCSEKRPKLSSPEGIRTRVRRAEIRGLNHYTKRAGFPIMLHTCKKSSRRI